VPRQQLRRSPDLALNCSEIMGALPQDRDAPAPELAVLVAFFLEAGRIPRTYRRQRQIASRRLVENGEGTLVERQLARYGCTARIWGSKGEGGNRRAPVTMTDA
jgi:hypothetical protein